MPTKSTFRRALRNAVESHIYGRGQQYYRDGLVGEWSSSETAAKAGILRISGQVIGGDIYDVTLNFDVEHEEFTELTCTCPYWDACKHSVALGLAFADSLQKDFTPPAATAKIFQSPQPLKPKEYYISVNAFNGFAPFLREKDFSYGQPSIRDILKQDGLTPAQRELLIYIKNGRFEQYDTPRPDLAYLFPLLVESGWPVYKDFSFHDTRPATINLQPRRLQAEIVHEPRTQYDDETKFRHDFFLRVPTKYWQKNQSFDTHPQPFKISGSCLVYEYGNVFELHQLAPLLVNMFDRLKPVYDYEVKTPVIKYYETRWAGEEVAQFEELYRDASQCLELLSPPPSFTVKESDHIENPSLVVDFDAVAQTLQVTPVVDYGLYRQDISESVYLSRGAAGHTLARRPPFEHPDGHIIVVEENVIHHSLCNEYVEKNWYRELSERAEEFGFTKTLKCRRRGNGPINDYLSRAWPSLLTYAQAKNYPIIFTTDQLAVTPVTLRADFTTDINADNNWLYFDVACYCDGERVTLDQIMQYQASGDTFWRKADGTLLMIGNRAELDRLARLLKSFQSREDGGFEGQVYHAPELEYVMTSSPHYNSVRAKSFQKFMAAVQSGRPVAKVRLPRRFAKILRPYQKAGVEWLYFLRSHHFAGILADDMGLGKTLQTLVVLAMERVVGRPSLIVCPKTLLYNWKLEAEKFTPELKVMVIEGTPAERREMHLNMCDYDLVIISYGTLKQDKDALAGSVARFNYTVLDEAQFIKNHATRNAQVVKKINADYRLALTGTPLENSVSEIWSIFDFLMPGFLGNYEQFARQFHKPIMDAGDQEVLTHLRRKVESFMLRRIKAEVLKELPPKIEQESQCRLSEAQNILYQQILAKVRGEVLSAVGEKGFKNAQIHILAGLTKLRQACNHPALLTKDKDWRAYESAKLDMCLELAAEVASGRRKVLIFSQFTQMLDIVAAALKERNIAYVYLSGKTKNRQALVDEFNTDPAIPVFLISLKAGGTGLNLTAADTVIIFDPWWNPSVENQAVDRAHRIGQTRAVNVYRLLTLGTIEEKIQALKKKKQNLFDALVNESGDLFKKLTWDDVRELFNL